MRSRVLFLIVAFAATVCDVTAQDWDAWEKNLNDNINSHLKGLDNLGERINAQLKKNLEGLDNLEEKINQQVYDSLKPVREMQARFRVKFGQKGTTIVTYPDKTLIVRDGVQYNCTGTISQKNGSCSGKLIKVKNNSTKDFCYSSTWSKVNNWYCLGEDQSSVSFSFINGVYDCKSLDGSKTLFLSVDELKKLCNESASYKYFSDTPLGDHDSNIQCSGKKPYVCTMTESFSE